MKFGKNEKSKADSIRFMEEILAKGYARKSTKTAAQWKTWYLPHHGVYHPNKPGKIRLVFHQSVQYKGTCLNKELLPGPDLTNQIISRHYFEVPVVSAADRFHCISILINTMCF